MSETGGSDASPPPDADAPTRPVSETEAGDGPPPGSGPPPGYGETGYPPPGYGQTGYAPPGYPPPGYGQTGYPPPGYPPPGPQPYGGYAAQPYGGYGRRIGEVRSWGMIFLLSLVTCGIYHLYWLFKMHEEVKDYSGQGVGGGLGLVLAILCGVVNYFLLPSEIEKMYQLDGQPSPISASVGFWVLLPIAGPIIWLAKVQETANDFWRARGAIG